MIKETLSALPVLLTFLLAGCGGGGSVSHSTDGAASGTRLDVTASIWSSRPVSEWPEVNGATAIALGKAPAGASHSASVYVVGDIAADRNIAGCLYISGSGRGTLFNS